MFFFFALCIIKTIKSHILYKNWRALKSVKNFNKHHYMLTLKLSIAAGLCIMWTGHQTNS